MKKRLLGYTLLLLCIASVTSAQSWKRYRREIVYSAGATNFLGDLGGANQIGTNFVKDLELSLTRPAVGIGYRYRLDRRQSLRGTIQAGILKGDDKLTEEPIRNNRNLNFRSPVVDISGIYEFNLFHEKSSQ